MTCSQNSLKHVCPFIMKSIKQKQGTRYPGQGLKEIHGAPLPSLPATLQDQPYKQRVVLELSEPWPLRFLWKHGMSIKKVGWVGSQARLSVPAFLSPAVR